MQTVSLAKCPVDVESTTRSDSLSITGSEIPRFSIYPILGTPDVNVVEHMRVLVPTSQEVNLQLLIDHPAEQVDLGHNRNGLG